MMTARIGPSGAGMLTSDSWSFTSEESRGMDHREAEMAGQTTSSTLAALVPGDRFTAPGLSGDVMRLQSITALPAGRVDAVVLNVRSLRVKGGPMAGALPGEMVTE